MSILAFSANAQIKGLPQGGGPLPNGAKQVNAGFGFSNNGLPVYGGMDFGVGSDITVGFDIGYRSYNRTHKGLGYRTTVFSMAAIANYHFNRILEIPNNWDVYAGLNVGYSNVSNRWNGSGDPTYDWSENSGLGLGLQVGARYYFNQNWAINLELNGGNRLSGGRIGVSYRL
ncbi:hypothetical protein PEPS_04250 [Persicobacter psychrovividus]|uniref:Outer membrane protein beta-barrel domain-containing protein n=2 Tax=Persicobacter psychrovividus TaxID=387638 RepID=A0ABM7VBS3_9BACT|nr:hypothetical protein PEPS_04250 [Persicobacter psychrovividus]